MKHFFCAIILTGCVLALTVATGGADVSRMSGKAATKAATKRKAAAERRAQALRAGEEIYNKVVASYMQCDWERLEKDLLASRKHFARGMNKLQRADIVYIRKTALSFRPNWWAEARSSTAVSFTAKIWNRPFMANYMPSESIGFTAPVGIRDGRIQTVVSWQPNLVDNTKPASGTLAEIHHISKGHIGEMVVWHELGHNYITAFLPLNHAITLYTEHLMLFQHLQEFYADMTAMYHCSPRARIAAMLIRLDQLTWYREAQPHTRSAHGIAALLLAEFLAHPDNWPSIHLPPKVPDKDVERNTIIYVYEHVDPHWTLGEDKALREMIEKFIRAKGEQVLRRKGEIQLSNGLSFRLMATDDRDLQPRRDKWVREMIEAAIAAGRTDKLQTDDEEKDKKNRQELKKAQRIEIPW